MPMPNPRSHRTINSFKPVLKWSLWLFLLVLIAMALLFAGGKLYQNWDQDPDRGAIPMPTSALDRKSTRLNSSHVAISYAVFCLNTTHTPCSPLFPYTTLFRSMPMPNPRSHRTINSFKPVLKWSLWLFLLVLIAMALLFAGGKLYQNWDQDPDRGAIPMPTSA